MNDTLHSVQVIINRVCDIDIDKISLDANTIDDLGIDSLDFLDLSFEIEKEFGIKLPLESWVETINSGSAELADYFVVGRIVDYIDGQIAAKVKG